MTRARTTSLLLTALAASACASGTTDPARMPGPGAAAAATAEPESMPAAAAATASFTDEQADRGRDDFRAKCTECHYSSEFSDAQFKFKWSRRSAGDLYDFILSQMPETEPGSLSPEEAVDFVSYILRLNGFDAGAAELAADPAVLDQVSLASIR